MAKRRKGKKPSNKKPAGRGGSERNYSKLDRHERKGRILTPPLMGIPGGLSLASWLNDRLPELLWVALIHERLGRENALAVIRVIAQTIHDAGDDSGTAEITLSGIARTSPIVRDAILQVLCTPPEGRTALRPLLLFPTLPAASSWSAAINEPAVPAEDWDHLSRAVVLVADHQSQEATDVRWAHVITTAAAGRVYLPMHLKGLGDEIIGYPNVGDMRAVRPSIRSMEGALRHLKADGTEERANWSVEFWDRCLAETGCVPVALSARTPPEGVSVGTSLPEVRAASSALKLHSENMSSTTNVDPRHEAAFGLAAYGLATLTELLRLANGAGILGRAGLRTILETFLTLAYLSKKDDSNTWGAYRSFGTGQAKLAFLKLDELTDVASEELPDSIDVSLLEALANEDRWQDFVEINLGHWDRSNLRRTSELADQKATYDRFYSWTSSFIHANWAAVRVTQFDICVNPLHRWHRVLRDSRLPLGDVVSDAASLVDGMLAIVDQLYPPFPIRVLQAPNPVVQGEV
jgi:hypothetical protein